MRDAEQLLLDLLNVEVNTIVKDDITAVKMPTLPFALLDIIERYAEVLQRAGSPLQRYFGPPREALLDAADAHYAKDPDTNYWRSAIGTYESISGGRFTGKPRELWAYLPNLWPLLVGYGNELGDYRQDPAYAFEMLEVGNGWDSFERLRIACLELRESGRAPANEADLARIISASNQIKYIVQGIEQRFAGGTSSPTSAVAAWAELIPRTRHELLSGGLHHKRPPSLLRTEDYRVLRKCWEIGTERVLVQTTVQLDGDVVTRMSSELLDGYDEDLRQLLLDTHRGAVDVGLSHWKSLVETTVELLSSWFQAPRRRR